MPDLGPVLPYLGVLLLPILFLGGSCALVFYRLRRRIRRLRYEVREELLEEMERLHQRIRNESTNLFQQIQLLPELQTQVGLPRGLPPLRGWAASPDFLLVLVGHVKEVRPRRLLECGSGASTVVLARCLQMLAGGHLYSLEHDPDFAATTRRRLTDLGLEAFATVIHAPLTRHNLAGTDWSWYSLNGLPDGPFDMMVIDGPPVCAAPLARYPAGPLLLSSLSPAGTCFLDDTNREDEALIVERWLREMPGLGRRDFRCEKGCVALTWEADASRDTPS
jgi:predicted O-methyltransferase YrrM